MTPDIGSTFNDTMHNITHAHEDADMLINAFDRYDHPTSTTTAEREQRANSHDGKCVCQLMGGWVTPLWDSCQQDVF